MGRKRMRPKIDTIVNPIPTRPIGHAPFMAEPIKIKRMPTAIDANSIIGNFLYCVFIVVT